MNTLTKGRKDMKHKIGIICAGEAEINPVLSYLTNEKTTEKAMLKFYEGQIEGCLLYTSNSMHFLPVFHWTYSVNSLALAR